MHQIFFFLLLVCLPTQLGYHTWPAWATVLGRRVDYLSPTLYVTDILLVLTVFSWVLTKKGKIFVKKKNILYGMIALSGIFFNVLFAANRMVAVYAWIKVLEYLFLGLYIVKTKPKFSFIVVPISIAVFYSSCIAIAQFILQRSVGGVFWFLGERTFSSQTPGIAQVVYGSLFRMRAYATFPHPNVLGGFLAVTLPLVTVYFFQHKKVFSGLTIVFGLTALMVTFSRSAWIVLVFDILSFMMWKKLKKIFLFFFIMITPFFLWIGSTFYLSDESVVVREQLNTAAVSLFLQSPIVGVGLGNFLVTLPNRLISRQIYFLQPVHNIYLLFGSETGVVGIAIFLFLSVSFVKRYWKKRTGDPLFLVHTSFFMLLCIGFVDHYPLTLQQGQLLLTLFCSLSLIQ